MMSYIYLIICMLYLQNNIEKNVMQFSYENYTNNLYIKLRN